VRYAKGLRHISALEQHTHSYLEILPLMAASVMICLRPKQFAAIFGRGDESARWCIEPKKTPLTARYVAGIVTGIGAFVVAPIWKNSCVAFVPIRTRCRIRRRSRRDADYGVAGFMRTSICVSNVRFHGSVIVRPASR
jgi:hypothetical protein